MKGTPYSLSRLHWVSLVNWIPNWSEWSPQGTSQMNSPTLPSTSDLREPLNMQIACQISDPLCLLHSVMGPINQCDLWTLSVELQGVGIDSPCPVLWIDVHGLRKSFTHRVVSSESLACSESAQFLSGLNLILCPRSLGGFWSECEGTWDGGDSGKLSVNNWITTRGEETLGDEECNTCLMAEQKLFTLELSVIGNYVDHGILVVTR